MTDEFRRKRYGGLGLPEPPLGMHYTRCHGEMVLIPDKREYEEYTFNGGSGQLYTERQTDALTTLARTIHLSKLSETHSLGW